MCCCVKFGSSASKGPPDPLQNASLSTCYPAEFGRSGTSVIKENCLKKLTLSRSLKVIGTDTYRSATYHLLSSYYRSMATMGLPCTVFKINGEFSRKSQFFPSRVFCPPRVPAEGVPVAIGYRRPGSKTRMMGLPGREKS